jgi:hypothetical protein
MHTTDSSAPASRHDELSREKKQVPFAEQIEFEFAADITTVPPKKRRRREASPHAKSVATESEMRVEERGEDRNDALSEDSKGAVFGDDWIDEVRNSITNARDLREAVTLSACYLAELIDLEVETRGYCDEWKQAYSAYCSVQLHSFTSTPDEDKALAVPRLAWAFAALIFYTYERANELSDWHLFEELCSGEMAPEDSGDSEEVTPEAYTINLFSCCLWAIHDIVCNGGVDVFSPENSCSAE